MKKYTKFVLLTLGFAGFMASCQCKTCTKTGENNVQVCRDNYNSDSDYNSAIGWYQVAGYACN